MAALPSRSRRKNCRHRHHQPRDSPSTVAPPDSDTQAIADHLIDFFKQEVAAGRMTNKLGPLQAGIGNIANAVMCGLIDSPFEDLTMYSEVLQDSTFDLIDAGKLSFASGSSITLSSRRNTDVFGNLERYKDKLVLRPQEISNHPEVVRRLGIIGINTALEFDLYGNVNSTHVCGTRMMNGIGGSGISPATPTWRFSSPSRLPRAAPFPVSCRWSAMWTIPSTMSTSW